MFEDGGQMRDFVHVHDVARANVLSIDAVLGRPAESWATYNVCSGSPVPILRVAQLLAEESGGPAAAGDRGLPSRRRPPRRRLPGLVATAELGFTAAIAPEQGIPEFARAPLRPAVGY